MFSLVMSCTAAYWAFHIENSLDESRRIEGNKINSKLEEMGAPN